MDEGSSLLHIQEQGSQDDPHASREASVYHRSRRMPRLRADMQDEAGPAVTMELATVYGSTRRVACAVAESVPLTGALCVRYH